jgi:hypothetical protein
MPKKRTSLDEFEPAPPSVRLVEDDRPSRRSPAPAPATPPLKLKSFRLPPEVVKRLALLKVETGRTEQDLAAEAFELLFDKLDS